MSVPPTRPALRARYDRKRLDLIEASARVFAMRGFHATSIEDISVETGLTAGGIYHYIEGKEQLLFLVCDDLMEPLLVEAQAIVAEGGEPEALLRRFVRTWVEHVAEHEHHMIVFQQERHFIEGDPRWRSIRRSRRRFEQLLDDILSAGEADGTFAFSDRRLAQLALLAMVNSMPQWYRPSGRLSPDEVADGFVDVLLGARPATTGA